MEQDCNRRVAGSIPVRFNLFFFLKEDETPFNVITVTSWLLTIAVVHVMRAWFNCHISVVTVANALGDN